MSEISRQHEQLAQNTLADKIRQETDAAKIQLLKESLIGSEATTVLPPKGEGWKSDYPVYLRKSPGSKQDINGIKPGAKLTIIDVAKETSDTKRGNGTSESHMWYKVEVVDSNDLNTKAYGNDNVGWVSAEFLDADTSHIHDIIPPAEGAPATVAPGTAPAEGAPATVAPGTAPAEGAPAEGNKNKETGPIFTRRNGETVLPWLVGPDGKTADFTQIQKEFEAMVTQKTKKIQENPTTKKANLVSDVVDIWISQARSEGSNVSDVETKQNSFNEAVNTLDGTPEKYTNLETAISELFASMQKVEKNDKEIIDDEELTKIEQIVNGVNSSTNIDEKRREIFSQMRSGFFDVDGASSGVAEKLTRTIMDNSPGNVEFTWLKGVLNDPRFIAELSISDTNRIKDYLEKAGLRGGDDAINTIIEKIKKVSEQRGEIEKDVRTYLEKEIANFDITNPTHKQYMDKVVEQSLGNQKKMIIEQEWMKFMIDTRPNFRNDPNINLLGGILGESAGWDMDIADENMGVMREIAITAALSAVPLGAGMAAARFTAVAGSRLIQGTRLAAGLASFASKGKWAARAVKTGEFITASAVEGGAFHVAYGAAGNVEEWALNTVGIDIDIVGDTYWEPKEWMKSMAMVAVFKGLSTGLSQVRGADKIPFSDIRTMKMGTLAKGGKMATETIKRMVQEISKVPVLGYSVTLGGEASAIMLIGEVFEQGGFPNFEEMTMAEFAQAVIMVLMGRAAGRVIKPIGKTQKPEDTNGPKDPLRIENGKPVLELMENSTHPEVLSTKLASLEKQYKTLKESGREGQRDRQELIRLNDEINALKKQISEQKPAAKEEPKAPKEKFTTTEKAADHGKMRDLELNINGINKQIESASRLQNKTTKTRELIRLNEQKTTLIKELNDIRNKYQIPTYEQAPNLATNITLGEFSAGVGKTAPKGKTENPKTETKSEKPAELTERQRLQRENAEANTEFDRLVNSTGNVEPKVLEAALAKKRATAEALQKFLSPDTTVKTKAPETKTPLTPEQIKSGKDLAEKIKKFTRGEGSYKTVLGDNGPNHIDIGGNLQITRHVEGGRFGLGRKETFSIQEKGSKTIGEKFTAEELTSRLNGEQQTQLTKVMDSIAKAGIHSRGNTTETSWNIDGTTHVKITQTGFASNKIQTFEGTRSGDTYNGRLTRNDGRVLEGSFKVQATVDRGHFDMVSA